MDNQTYEIIESCDRSTLLRQFGIETREIRCPQGHKLLEVETPPAACMTLHVKCRRCGKIYRVRSIPPRHNRPRMGLVVSCGGGRLMS